MNVIIPSSIKKRHFREAILFAAPFAVPVLVLILLGIDMWYRPKATKEPPHTLQEPPMVEDSVESIIGSIAPSYSVPVGPMVRFAGFLKDNQFNERYGGVGLFSVRPSHLDWVKENILKDTDLNLEDNIQNTQIACFLLNRFKGSGYSWIECFLVYTYGWGSIHDLDKHADFIKEVFQVDR